MCMKIHAIRQLHQCPEGKINCFLTKVYTYPSEVYVTHCNVYMAEAIPMYRVVNASYLYTSQNC